MHTILQDLQATAKEKDSKWSLILGEYALNFDQINGINYFAGNSLGLQPNGFGKKLAKHSMVWRRKQHNGHFEEDGTDKDRPWWRYQEKLVKTGALLLGAKYNAVCPEVAFLNTLSVNTRNLIETFAMYLRDHSEFSNFVPGIVTIKSNFPSDDVGLKYALNVVFGKGKYKLIEVEPMADGKYDFDHIIKVIKTEQNVKMGFFPGLCYVTGQRFPIKRLTFALHSVGAVAGFDLAHSVGNYQLSLHTDGVDFATFCGYKYLNGGPGAVGGIFIHQDWFNQIYFEYVSGWFGINMDDRFNFDPNNYRPAPGAWGLLQSNDQIFNMLGVEAFFDIVDKHGKDNIFEKHEEISTYLFECLKCIPQISIITPEPFDLRGCQISFKVKNMGVDEVLEKILTQSFCEKRGKDIIRVTPVGYNTFMQVWKFCDHLNKIVTGKT